MKLTDNDLKWIKAHSFTPRKKVPALPARLEALQGFYDAIDYDFIAADDELLFWDKKYRKAAGQSNDRLNCRSGFVATTVPDIIVPFRKSINAGGICVAL